MTNFLTVAQQVAVLFALMGVGAAMRRARLLRDAAIDGMVNLLILIVTPCIIVDVFQRPFSPSMLKGLGIAFALAVAAHLAVIALSRLAVRHRDENVQRPMRLAAVFSNAGFMGLPLEQAVLGDEGVFYGIVYVAVFNLFMWSWGLKEMKSDEVKVERDETRERVRNGGTGETAGGGLGWFDWKMVVNPGTVGIALGLPLFFLSVTLPPLVATPVHLISELNTPLAMIVIGFGLAGAKLGKVARQPVVYVATAIRLVVCPLLVIAAMYPFRQVLARDMMLAITIAAAAPVAAMVSMFATKFARDVDTSVAVVSGSTLLSIVTIPPIVAFAMAVL